MNQTVQTKQNLICHVVRLRDAIEQHQIEDERLREKYRQQREVLHLAGQWIQQADIAMEPGFAGSRQHILNKITRVLDDG